jgi:hypothetical protein
MAKVGSRHLPGLIILAIFLGLVVPPFVNLGRYRAYIADAMSRALQRPVTFDSISLRLLPQPGFDFENFVIGDDPAYSAEPILRAEQVTAYLRISSLWRGRLELARLSLSYPSLNLVRLNEGNWNIESLLYRASKTAAAPTTAIRPQSRPRFPYIEASDGRINFKYGLEKQVFTFTEAKFSIWSPGENELRLRLQAKPVRTDIPVADTGMVQAEGSLRRAEQLRDTQINLDLSLERSQLGQLTRLASGRDRGWRGSLDVSAHLAGTPADLKFVTDTSLQDFRRYDIMQGEPLNIQSHCTGALSAVHQSIANLHCVVPTGEGFLTVRGSMQGWKAQAYTVGLDADKVPMNWVTAVARHTKRDLPRDLTADGTVTGQFDFTKNENGPAPELTGSGSTTGFVLKTSLLDSPLTLGEIHLVAAEPPRKRSRVATQVAFEPRLEVGSFPVPLGLLAPATASGWLSRQGYSFSVTGDGDVARILSLARTAGIGVPRFQLKGTATLKAQLVGEWKGFVQSSATGSMEVKNVTAEVPGISAPVRLASADVLLQQNTVTLRRINAGLGPLKATGSATFPRHCEDDQPCVSQLDIQTDEVDLDEINRLLNPRLKKRPWYSLFGVNGEHSVLASWDADGTLAIRHLVAKSLEAGQVTMKFDLHRGKLAMRDVQATVFGGTHTGDWSADFTGDEPRYAGIGTVSNLSVADVAAIGKDAWGAGTLNGAYELKFSGWQASDLFASANGSCQFQWRNGSLRHLTLDGRTNPVRFPLWAGQCQWSPEGFRVSGSKMRTVSGIYQISGTVQPTRDLQLEFVRADGTAYEVTGTLENPRVIATPVARTAEAALHR